MANQQSNKAAFKSEFLNDGGVTPTDFTEMLVRCLACNRAIYESIGSIKDEYPVLEKEVNDIWRSCESTEDAIKDIMARVVASNLYSSNYREL